MRTLLSAALLFAGVAQASPSFNRAPAPRPALDAILAQSSTDEDEDEDESPASTPAPPAPSVTAPAPSAPAAAEQPSTPAAQAPAAPAPSPAAPAAPAGPAVDPQKLVFGAPLYNPSVGVHTVEKKQFADKGTHELVLYPGWVQVNGKFTNHAGSGITYLYHLQENFALQLSPIYNWYNAESSLNEELINKARVEAQAATSLLLNWGATAGVEVTPLYGKFAFYEGSLAHFSLVVSGGAGLGSTRHQLKPPTTEEDAKGVKTVIPPTFGDTGLKFMGQVGVGLRVQLGTRFTLRLEVRDLVYSAQVTTVNGCSGAELEKIKTTTDAGLKPQAAGVSSACRYAEFGQTTEELRRDANLARNLVLTPSSDVLNNVGFYAGLGFIF